MSAICSHVFLQFFWLCNSIFRLCNSKLLQLRQPAFDVLSKASLHLAPHSRKLRFRNFSCCLSIHLPTGIQPLCSHKLRHLGFTCWKPVGRNQCFQQLGRVRGLLQLVVQITILRKGFILCPHMSQGLSHRLTVSLTRFRLGSCDFLLVDAHGFLATFLTKWCGLGDFHFPFCQIVQIHNSCWAHVERWHHSLVFCFQRSRHTNVMGIAIRVGVFLV
mmetsp:Transcript_67997/g.137875  ORF Transcript_67997/g.137875 Transcript_67997/m.137875 type:complete len:217 (-) Transcript_67997:912-1562(-)